MSISPSEEIAAAKWLEYALKADENNDLIYGNAGAVIVLLNLYHLAQKDIYLQLACEAGNILIKNQNKGKENIFCLIQQMEKELSIF